MKLAAVLGLLGAFAATSSAFAAAHGSSGLGTVVISSPSSGSPTSNSATITWTNTPAANGQVCYGAPGGGAGVYGTCTTRHVTAVTSDTETLSGLTSSATYHYKVNATATGYVQGFSSDQTFATAASSGGAAVQLTPAAGWNGTLLSGFGGSQPSAPTQTITALASDASSGNCGGAAGCFQVTVAATGSFGATAATGLACVKFVSGTAGLINGCWPYYVVNATTLDLRGSTFVAGDALTPNYLTPAVVGVAYGAQAITAAAGDGTTNCGGAACYKLTVGSTANMTTGDPFSVFSAGGATGTWPITVADATHVVLGTSAQPGPKYVAFSPTANSLVAFNEIVIGGIDEDSGHPWESGNEYITVNGAIGNRNWINRTTCAFENASGSANTSQIANPNYGDDGYVFQLMPAASNQQGLAGLYCDIIPYNGLALRQAINIWVNNNAVGPGYLTRPVAYVDSSQTADSGACTAQGRGASGNPYQSINYGMSCVGDGGIVYVSNKASASLNPGTNQCTATGLTALQCYTQTNSGCGVRCFPNAHRIDVRSWREPAVSVTAIAWASGTATLTLSSVPAGWTAGTVVQITGMFPLEYNGQVVLTAATTGAGGTISYVCCTIGAATGFLNPAAVHPGVTVILGQAVVPYVLEVSGAGITIYTTAVQLSAFQGADLDQSTITAIRTCYNGNCGTFSTSQPWVQGLTLTNSCAWDSNGIGGTASGYYGVYGVLLNTYFLEQTQYPTGPDYSIITNWEESCFLGVNAFGGGSSALIRNAEAVSIWKIGNFGYGAAFPEATFVEDAKQPLVPSGLTGLPAYIFPSSGLFIPVLQRQTINPPDNHATAPCTAGVAVTTQCMPAIADVPVHSTTAGAPCNSNCTTFNIYTAAIIGFVNNTTAVFLSGNCLYSAIVGSVSPSTYVGNIATYTSVSSAQSAVTLSGDWVDGTGSGGICAPGGGIAQGDTVFLYAWAHPDFVQINQPYNGSMGITDMNIYMQRVSYFGLGIAPLVQSGAYPGNTGSTGNLTSVGTAVTVTSIPAGLPPQVGDFIEIRSGANNYQYRQITAVSPSFSTSGLMTVDYPFTPDIGVAAQWDLVLTVADIACVACRVGGSNQAGIAPVSGTAAGNSMSKAEWQNGCEHCITIQSTYAYQAQVFYINQIAANGCAYANGCQGPGYGMRDVIWLDSIFGGGCLSPAGTCSGSTINGGSTMELYQSTGTLWTSTNSDGTFVYDGYVFDDDNYNVPTFGGVTQVPGSNITTQQVTFTSDGTYRPTPGTLTTTARGIAGSGNLLFPFTADGVPAATGVIGAMQP